MRIAHLADLHLGKKWKNVARNAESQEVLEEIITLIREEQVDIVLLAGDIFDYDGVVFDAKSMKLFLDFISQLRSIAKVKKIYAISGNHDDSALVSLDHPLIQQNLQLYLHLHQRKDVGFLVPRVYPLEGEGEIHFLYTVPYVFPFAKSSEDHEFHYAQRYTELIRWLMVQNLRDKREQYPLAKHIFMGHLFLDRVAMKSRGESVQTFREGLDLEVFFHPEEDTGYFDYILLGHIHKRQRIPHQRSQIYYAGSTLFSQFGEDPTPKGFWVFDTQKAVVKEKILQTPYHFQELQFNLQDWEDFVEQMKHVEYRERTYYKFSIDWQSTLSFPQQRILKHIREFFPEGSFKLELERGEHHNIFQKTKEDIHHLDLSSSEVFFELFEEFYTQGKENKSLSPIQKDYLSKAYAAWHHTLEGKE